MSNTPIARRSFTIGPRGTRQLEARVYAPVADGDDYRCDYEIVEDGTVASAFHAMGVDSLQALILGLQRLGVELTCSDHARMRDLYWNDHNDDLGLLLPPGFED